ncbi:exported hypothetical protein [Micromonospora lupini str. Lupac 08]|uniref:Uncharacterized protein n=1 Tax=Micromonospora lupini str. Lupac 08 TaxID=1150864 RepID=I0L156_9ACTN|nr:exported hypothetical protein [Micromonospora lupini str. Lupac 08]
MSIRCITGGAASSPAIIARSRSMPLRRPICAALAAGSDQVKVRLRAGSWVCVMDAAWQPVAESVNET